ncbi:MAG TPA: hypothetical protein VEK55_05255 [Xanthobacteraceae bacterium]|nr:hypothetical protein [Xanthobacteraceae bacterium]
MHQLINVDRIGRLVAAKFMRWRAGAPINRGTVPRQPAKRHRALACGVELGLKALTFCRRLSFPPDDGRCRHNQTATRLTANDRMGTAADGLERAWPQGRIPGYWRRSGCALDLASGANQVPLAAMTIGANARKQNCLLHRLRSPGRFRCPKHFERPCGVFTDPLPEAENVRETIRCIRQVVTSGAAPHNRHLRLQTPKLESRQKRARALKNLV